MKIVALLFLHLLLGEVGIDGTRFNWRHSCRGHDSSYKWACKLGLAIHLVRSPQSGEAAPPLMYIKRVLSERCRQTVRCLPVSILLFSWTCSLM